MVYLGTLSFADDLGTFSMYRLIGDQYLGIMQGRPRKLGLQVMFFRGTRPTPDTLLFSNSVFAQRKIMKPGPVVNLDVKFNDERFLTKVEGTLTPEEGEPVGMVMSGFRTPIKENTTAVAAGIVIAIIIAILAVKRLRVNHIEVKI